MGDDVYRRQKYRIKELEDAVAMADNRLEAALLGEKDICRHCIEVAKSYLEMVKPEAA